MSGKRVIPYAERARCVECGRPAGPFGSCGFPDFCDCDQREGATFVGAVSSGGAESREENNDAST